MEESEKFKKEQELKKLEALEKSIKINDEKKIQELLNEIDSDVISLENYIQVIDSKVSFKLHIENNTEEE
ncbi:hypothetical protein C8N46_11382 [Kordia periserrulae]|uniref:Uncharacterized protein n=1 Tax=Kordia periserrulae TaxID=701523 RepID=A0A2T6BR65_9FLAO|nr:hypothetical protein [Kordia periserrulae]PTX58591.1 hypothetical protein C8N46_11382 [Kordia periserrulae]